MSTTDIEWATHVWNFTRGCRRVSLGCGGPNGEGGCYAEKTAFRFSGPGMPYEGLVTLGKNGPRWNGKGRFLPEKLEYPLSVRAPKDGSRHRFFVNSMSDLFFEAFSNEEIAAAFGVMAACPKHDFLILTKRPERMVEWFKWIARSPVSLGGPTVNSARGVRWHAWHYLDDLRVHDPEQPWAWPLKNCWLGVSVENQQTADERIPLLLETPAAVRFISAEPLLGPLDIAPWLRGSTTIHMSADVSGLLRNKKNLDSIIDGSGRRLHPSDALAYLEKLDDQSGCGGHRNPRLDWVIAGGESGPGARPCALEWLESIVAQCREASTPCFVKQLGACVVSEHRACDTDEEAAERFGFSSRWLWRAGLQDKKGGDPAEWPDELQVRQFPEVRS